MQVFYLVSKYGDGDKTIIRIIGREKAEPEHSNEVVACGALNWERWEQVDALEDIIGSSNVTLLNPLPSLALDPHRASRTAHHSPGCSFRLDWPSGLLWSSCGFIHLQRAASITATQNPQQQWSNKVETQLLRLLIPTYRGPSYYPIGHWSRSSELPAW